MMFSTRLALLLFSCFVLSTTLADYNAPPSLHYEIARTWDNLSVTEHDPIEVTLTGHGDKLDLVFRGPFFDEPSGPDGPPGEPYWGLWNYEAVKAFFVGDHNNYLEVELVPQGQHLVFLLKGRKNDIADCLPLNYSATIKKDKWEGRACVPIDYFPPNVAKFNAYAVHGCGSDRHDEALYPVPHGKYRKPDTHRLEYFKPINFASLLPANANSQFSKTWKDALAGNLHFTCNGMHSY